MASVSPPSVISLAFTDEELILSLERMVCGSILPQNVIADVNPFQYQPKDLPDGIWYFIRSEPKNDSKHGFWKAKGEACGIFTNSNITGWRTTFEYYEGPFPCGQKTNWVTQEYTITQKGRNDRIKLKESSSLCRIYFSSGEVLNQEILNGQNVVDIFGENNFHPGLSVVQQADNTIGQGRFSESQIRSEDVDAGTSCAAMEPANIPADYMPEIGFLLGDDYLELNDLATPVSPSSSSENTSCLTMSSDECFDQLALLQDLEDEINRNLQRKDANLTPTVAASTRTSNVVMYYATLDSLGSSEERNSPVQSTAKSSPSPADSTMDKNFQIQVQRPHGNAINSQMDHKSKNMSNPRSQAAASSSHNAVPKIEKEAHVGRTRKFKGKYLCFMPF